MKKHSKLFKLLSMLMLLLVPVMLVGCGGGAEETGDAGDAGESEVLPAMHFKIAHEEPAGTDQDFYCHAFVDHLNELSGGQYTADIYTLGQLGEMVSQAELIQNGTVEIGYMSTGTSAVFVPEVNIHSLHFTVPGDYDDESDFLNNSKGQAAIEEEMYKKNFKVLEWTTSGPDYWTGNKAINTPADWEGVKMRVMGTPIIIATFEAYGANTTPTAYTELYSGLQLHMVDGQTNPLSCIYNMKFHEVQDYIMYPGSNYLPASFTINTGVWESLPPEGQAMLEEAADLAGVEYNEHVKDGMQGYLDKITESGVEYIELTDEARAEFKALAETVYPLYVETCGDRAQEILDLFLEETAEYEAN